MANVSQFQNEAVLERIADTIKCLGHPLRLRLLAALEGGDLTVTELQRATGAPQALVSHQLSILRGHNVVAAARDGLSVRYAITEPRVRHLLDCIRSWGRLVEEKS